MHALYERHATLGRKEQCTAVYKMPYRRAHAWPSGCILRVRARAKVSCIQSSMLVEPQYVYSFCVIFNKYERFLV